MVSDPAVDTIGRFCSFFLQNVSFIYVTKPQNLFGVVWMGFNPLKPARKLTLGVFQNLLSNSVNSASLFYCLLDLASSELARAADLQDLLSYSVYFENVSLWSIFLTSSEQRNIVQLCTSGDGDDDKENSVFEMFRTGWNSCFCFLEQNLSCRQLMATHCNYSITITIWNTEMSFLKEKQIRTFWRLRPLFCFRRPLFNSWLGTLLTVVGCRVTL